MKSKAPFFLMMLLAITFFCLPVFPGIAEAGFSDVGTEHWARKPINTLVEHDLIRGYPDGTFRPASQVKRNEFAVILASVGGSKLQSYQGEYQDVPAGSWYGPAAEAVKPYLPGVEDKGGVKLFKPVENATRQDVVAAMVKILKVEYYQADPLVLRGKFSDYNLIDGDNRLPIAWAVQNNLVRGFPNGTFGPDEGITRAEVAAFLYRALYIDATINGLIKNDQITPFTTNAATYQNLVNNLNKNFGVFNSLGNKAYSVSFAARDQETYSGEGPELLYIFGAIDNFNYLNWTAELNEALLGQTVEYCKKIAFETAQKYPGKQVLVTLGHTRTFFFDVRDVYGNKYLQPVDDGWKLNRFYSGAMVFNGAVIQTWQESI